MLKVLMVSTLGIEQVAHADGTVAWHDPETGIVQQFKDFKAVNPKPGACPFCGSYKVLTHQIMGVAPGDQDCEKVCLDCGKEW